MGQSKYRNIRTEVDGIKFASRAEAKRYQELKILAHVGEITRLDLQPRYDCWVNDTKVCTYIADFRYFTDGRQIIEDVKGMKTPLYKLKKKLVEACYPGVKIIEIRYVSGSYFNKVCT